MYFLKNYLFNLKLRESLSDLPGFARPHKSTHSSFIKFIFWLKWWDNLIKMVLIVIF
jgi:hypothetical protein